jgi:hypothetical protein
MYTMEKGRGSSIFSLQGILKRTGFMNGLYLTLPSDASNCAVFRQTISGDTAHLEATPQTLDVNGANIVTYEKEKNFARMPASSRLTVIRVMKPRTSLPLWNYSERCMDISEECMDISYTTGPRTSLPLRNCSEGCMDISNTTGPSKALVCLSLTPNPSMPVQKHPLTGSSLGGVANPSLRTSINNEFVTLCGVCGAI